MTRPEPLVIDVDGHRVHITSHAVGRMDRRGFTTGEVVDATLYPEITYRSRGLTTRKRGDVGLMVDVRDIDGEPTHVVVTVLLRTGAERTKWDDHDVQAHFARRSAA